MNCAIHKKQFKDAAMAAFEKLINDKRLKKVDVSYITPTKVMTWMSIHGNDYDGLFKYFASFANI